MQPMRIEKWINIIIKNVKFMMMKGLKHMLTQPLFNQIRSILIIGRQPNVRSNNSSPCHWLHTKHGMNYCFKILDN